MNCEGTSEVICDLALEEIVNVSHNSWVTPFFPMSHCNCALRTHFWSGSFRQKCLQLFVFQARGSPRVSRWSCFAVDRARIDIFREDKVAREQSTPSRNLLNINVLWCRSGERHLEFIFCGGCWWIFWENSKPHGSRMDPSTWIIRIEFISSRVFSNRNRWRSPDDSRLGFDVFCDFISQLWKLIGKKSISTPARTTWIESELLIQEESDLKA